MKFNKSQIAKDFKYKETMHSSETLFVIESLKTNPLEQGYKTQVEVTIEKPKQSSCFHGLLASVYLPSL